MKRLSTSAWGAVALISLGSSFVLTGAVSAPAQQPTQETPAVVTPVEQDAAEQAERITALEKSLSGAVLIGHFTVNGAGEVKPRDERYELASVKHLQGDTWMISARIKYGEHDVTLPLPLPIRWAGDTPVIELDNFTVPGMGAFSARVMFYEHRYMGYWFASGNQEHGGYLFGVIEPPKADADAKDAEKATPAK